MKKQFTFDNYSKTIRLMPENHLVATTEKGHIVVDADAAIDDELAATIFVLLRQHTLKFCRNMSTVIEKLNVLLTENFKFYSKMGQYLSEDQEHYDKIIEVLRATLDKNPDQMLDYVEIEKDGKKETIAVWEQVQFLFTVGEFCEIIGIE